MPRPRQRVAQQMRIYWLKLDYAWGATAGQKGVPIRC